MDATHDYFKRLTAAEFDEHERIEAELNSVVRDGFTERSALAFVVTVAAVRKKVPGATIAGIFNEALIGGLEQLLSRLTETQPTRSPKRRPSRLVT
jgi:lipoate synthase